ncbi:MAG: ABC transporter permease subunit [Streptosporangiales bacterium]|nr:ABC transporter permease subunit [Streptosporangiales bacterium]
MVGVPTIINLCLVWLPALASVVLSFTRWDGIGLEAIEWAGTRNYEEIVTTYPPFWPALAHNVIWLAFFILIATPAGLLLAVLLDKGIKGTRIYQSAIYLPVVLSLAIVGFIWQLLYSPDQGMINQLFNIEVDWFGNPRINLWAVLVAASWRHVGYVMILYLAGLKGVDPTLKEAAAIDGASEWQAFRKVVFPAMRPVNVVVLVITVIESLRAFDLVYVINGGRNGLELLSALVTQNIIGEASRIGYGSAIAAIMLVISTVFIVVYVTQILREEKA